MCKEIEEAFERYKEEVTPSLESMKKQMKTIDEALTGLKTRHGEICKQLNLTSTTPLEDSMRFLRLGRQSSLTSSME